MRDSRFLFAWLLLLGLTLASFGSTGGGRLLNGAALIIAFVKARIIILEFMELRHAPTWLRSIVEGWAWLSAMLLIIMLTVGGQT